jgi:replication factor C subunit 2/4
MEDLFAGENVTNNQYNDEDNLLSKRYGKDGDELWVEKYRPKKIDDIIEQEEIIKVLRNTLETGELPHLLIHGPPGTGKTSTILALAYQLFGPNKFQDRVVELNASDDRGINIVRKNIVTFAKLAVGSKDPDYPCPDFKLIILDEADAMTPEAQAALRKIMEKTSGITRFCFTCNYIQQILDPISSRCMKFRFKPLDPEAIVKRLKEISKLEKLHVSDECIRTIVTLSEGDARRSIMCLQHLKYFVEFKGEVFPCDVIEIMGGINTKLFSNVWKQCINGTVLDVRNLTSFIHDRLGSPLSAVIIYLRDSVIYSNLKDKQKAKIAIELALSDKRLAEGANEYIQLLNVLLSINKYANEKC